MPSLLKRSLYLSCIALAVLSSCAKGPRLQTPADISSPPPKTYELVNGQWFDGQGFRRQTFYSVDRLLTRDKPPRVDAVLDLEGGYVVPPFADAHCHHFATPAQLRQHIEMYLRDGVFYAKVQGNVRSAALQLADQVNRPTSVDVTYAHGSLTSSYGHGMEVYEGLALFGRAVGFSAEETQRLRESRLRDNDGYYIIDIAQDLEQKWPRILEGRPDFIKLQLLTSEEFTERSQRTDTIGDRGLDPRVVPAIVEKAHAAGLRVSVHVDTMTDYRIALSAGSDEMAHLPGYYYYLDSKDDRIRYELTEADARETARRGIWVDVAPVAVPLHYGPPDPAREAEIKARRDALRVHNLGLLKRFKVKLAFGSDRYGSTDLDDVLHLQKLGVFSNLEILKIWCEDTPRSIFPKRKIGSLKPGHEASFLVLGGNPLLNFEQVKNITLRFKQGDRL